VTPFSVSMVVDAWPLTVDAMAIVASQADATSDFFIFRYLQLVLPDHERRRSNPTIALRFLSAAPRGIIRRSAFC
jgi:hypothetical protein